MILLTANIPVSEAVAVHRLIAGEASLLLRAALVLNWSLIKSHGVERSWGGGFGEGAGGFMNMPWKMGNGERGGGFPPANYDYVAR